ncbi:MAG: hypothetical protein RLZ63_1941 [Pseudomonadota bacterium]|jgi:hypothetical protein
MSTHFSYFQNLALATIFAAVYYLAFWIQVHWLGSFDFVQGVSLLFLPAGIKMLSIVVGGAWGLGGVFVTSMLLSRFVWGDHGFVYALLAQIVWAGVPYLTYQLLKRQLQIDEMLLSLKGSHIAMIAVATSLTSSLADRSFRYAAGQVQPDMFNTSVWAMMLGDVGGIVVVLSLSVLLVQHLRKSHA